MKSDIGAAVVGVGFIGVAHVEALRRLGVEVVGVVGSSPERASQKAEAANLPPAFPNLEAALDDPNVDVVHLATPNHLHAEQARAVLDAGKHVVCEKPLALDTAETVDLLARAEASGKVHAVCFNIRFYPLCHQAEALVRTGEIGRPLLVHGGYIQDWLLLETDWNWRLESEKAGRLRAVADIGSHWLDLARFVTGQRITEVMADLHTLIPVRRHPPGPVETFAKTIETDDLIEEEMTSDDAAGVLLRFEDGARGDPHHFPDLGGEEELVELGGGRFRRRPVVVLRGPRPALDRPPGAPQRDMASRPGAGHRRCRPPHRVSRRTCRGVPRHLPGALRRGLRRGGRGAPAK